ncbi:hypothetical protein AM500_17930 [Bacillus sp. FJAT-18017]|nr:hypothetical protein AM500_17930 [Bacillus sp. FJAT-18017]
MKKGRFTSAGWNRPFSVKEAMIFSQYGSKGTEWIHADYIIKISRGKTREFEVNENFDDEFFS